MCFCFFKKKTAYEMRISDWSSDVCSSDLFGGKVSFFIPALNEMDLSFYAMKYNSRLPVISGISKSSYAAPSETGRYFIEYPDDIPLYGVSFNTTVGPWAAQGEYSLKVDQPLQVDDEIGRASCRGRVCQYV